jgi:hypothetical protein
MIKSAENTKGEKKYVAGVSLKEWVWFEIIYKFVRKLSTILLVVRIFLYQENIPASVPFER